MSRVLVGQSNLISIFSLGVVFWLPFGCEIANCEPLVAKRPLISLTISSCIVRGYHDVALTTSATLDMSQFQPQHRQASTHSSSPSKSSLRRTSGPQQNPNPNPSPRSLLPSPHFEDDPIVASHQSPQHPQPIATVDPEYSEHAIESEQYPHTQSSLIPPFTPFFTLIEDTVTSEHHHPTVHYLFADDDSDIIAEAACRSLETLDPSQRALGQPKNNDRRQSQSQDVGHDDQDVTSRPGAHLGLPPRIAGVREHYIIVDVQPRAHLQSPDDPLAVPSSAVSSSAFEVTSATSLSAEWQVLRTSITAAPTISDGGPSEDDGLMLRIDGRGNTPADVTTIGDKNRDRDSERESMEEMIELFQRRFDEIRQVMDAGVAAGVAVEEGG